MSTIRVLIVDDHALVRAGLALLLSTQPDLEVVGQAGSLRSLMEQVKPLKPDIITLDVNLPDGNGLAALGSLRAACPEARILVLTVHNDPAYAQEALAGGAHGYLAKTAADTELIAAIRALHQKRIIVDLDTNQPVAPKFEVRPVLSAREREVLTLLARGHTNQQVADQLYLSVKTVETYRARLVEKLGFRDRADLVRYAVEMGMLSAQTFTESEQGGNVKP